MSKERELLKRWLAGEANQIPTHVPLLIETQNLLAQPEALAPEREFIRLWYENIELWKVHAEEPEQEQEVYAKGYAEAMRQQVYEAFEAGRKSALSNDWDKERDVMSEARYLPESKQEPVAWMNDSGGCFLSDGNKYSEYWTALYTSPPKQLESTAEAIMPNGVCVSNVYDAYEEGRKSVMSEQEPLTNEQKSAEAALEQALRDSIDTEKLMQILKDGGILIEVGGQK